MGNYVSEFFSDAEEVVDIVHSQVHPERKEVKRHDPSLNNKDITEGEVKDKIEEEIKDPDITECKMPDVKVTEKVTTIYQIYVLRLERDKYYIGKSKHSKVRIMQHMNGEGSEWTKLYKPLECLTILNCLSIFDEDKYTLEYMLIYGIDNVRGGTYSQVTLSSQQVEYINDLFKSALNKCYICGKTDHFIRECPVKRIREESVRTSKSDIIQSRVDIEKFCSTCGRNNHTAAQCYANNAPDIVKYGYIKYLANPRDTQLFDQLRTWRRSASLDMGIEPYMILKDEALREIAFYKPINRQSLLRVNGIGLKKIEEYGDDILTMITSFLNV